MGRYDSLIAEESWRQKFLTAAKVLIGGAGALGNEILKLLALLGVGAGTGGIVIVDFDTVELANLAKSILFRESDEGKKKAKFAAQRVKELNPDVRTIWFDGNLYTDIGLGIYRRMDAIIAGVDNLEARVRLSQIAWLLKVPYIDGGTDFFSGQARIFTPPVGPCYECILEPDDYIDMNRRYHCNQLTRSEMLGGKVPTSPITSSIIAAFEVQLLMELLHKRDLPVSKTIVYNGQLKGGDKEVYMSRYDPIEADWHRHSEMQSLEKIIELPEKANSLSIGRALKIARKHLGQDAVIELRQDFIIDFTCDKCRNRQKVSKLRLKCTEEDIKCSKCGTQAEKYRLLHTITGEEKFIDFNSSIGSVGVCPLDIFYAHNGKEVLCFELTGDAQDVLIFK
jgi:adenylyltransferase/sulfurtransferase